MFTLDIAGKAIAITDADEAQARELFNSEPFKDDIQAMESEGEPLWDGKAPLTVRAASKDELEAFEEAMQGDDDADGAAANDDQDEDGINVVFLVSVDEFDDEDDA